MWIREMLMLAMTFRGKYCVQTTQCSIFWASVAADDNNGGTYYGKGWESETVVKMRQNVWLPIEEIPTNGCGDRSILIKCSSFNELLFFKVDFSGLQCR